MEQQTPTPTATSSSATAPTVPLPAPRRGSEHLVMILPHEEGERQAEAMETLLQACATDSPFALELAGTRREQVFLLRASSSEQQVLLCKQLEAHYPQAEHEQIAPEYDPLVLRPGERAVVGTFALARPSWMPLKTFSGNALAQPGGDPILGILAAMEPLSSGERIICQLALERAPDQWIDRYVRKAVEHPLQEERDKAAAARATTSASVDAREGSKLLAGVLLALVGFYGYRWYHEQAWGLLVLLALMLLAGAGGVAFWHARRRRRTIYDMKLVAEKLVRAPFYTHLHVIVIGPQAASSEGQLRTHLHRLAVAYRQFGLASANSLVLRTTRVLEDGVACSPAVLTDPARAFRKRSLVRRLVGLGRTDDVWNGLEVAGAYHLPQELADVPLVRRLVVKHLLASPQISHQVAQQHAPQPPALIGRSRQRNHCIPVYLPFDTLFAHKFLVARSRYGKSTLMQLLLAAAMQEVTDATAQPGIFAIDPHHDLIEDLLLLIPAARARDVLLLDLTDTRYPVALNPLDASMGFSRDQAIANLISSFKQIWADTWGPRMEHFLKNVCLLLYTLNEGRVRAGRAEEQYTLLDINPLLQYQDYALALLHQLDASETWHQEMLSWWQHTYFMLPKASSFRQEVIMPILTKLGVFSDNQQLRRIVGQPVTRAPLHEVVTEGKIVLCALSARDMDDSSVNILGSTLINLLRRSFRLQEGVPLPQRRKVFLAIDEFQAFSGADIGKLLSEDAKYGCATLLATQFLKQLDTVKKGLLDTVLGNCENLWAFNVSASDARLLEEELQGKVTQKHIIAQPRLHCYARLAFAGYPMQILSLDLARPASWQRTASQISRAEAIREASQHRYREAVEVDRLHALHVRGFLDVRPFTTHIDQEVRKRQAYQSRRDEREQKATQMREDMAQARAAGAELRTESQAKAPDQNATKIMSSSDGTGRQSTPSTPEPASLRARSLAFGTAPSTAQEEEQQQHTQDASSHTQTPDVPGSASSGSSPAGSSSSDSSHAGSTPSGSSPSEAQSEEQGRHRRSHTRSRRKKRLQSTPKTPVGTPLPLLPREDGDEQQWDEEELEGANEADLAGGDVRPIPPVNLGRGYGLEGRERGERA